ncbi:hypothetical protein PV10_03449 [Exophiala mesophila]|uniref:F-box domain-containing protein n=1 Tax=Exophiala mesophila TaxID=212818 RepID=A0A0D1ZMG7_EXOME|nr:uncharacterized protein PV10_03449 [Exophiala mesophila]KIV95842.1 hypothetical protein PV10_03449 [Exophiala mesophila]
MEILPQEILVDVLDHLEAEDLISAQQTCHLLSKSARTNTLWRYKCFEKSPSATMGGEKDILKSLTGALRSLSLSDDRSNPPPAAPANSSQRPEPQTYASRRARAVNRWDLSDQNERIDWYSEYKARHAPLRMEWMDSAQRTQDEIRGISVFDNSTRLIGYLEDHSLRIWDLRADSNGKRRFAELGRSKPLLPSTDLDTAAETLVVDCVSSFPAQKRAFVAIDKTLNEVDLNTMQVVSRSKYSWPITALSQSSDSMPPLTVGTQWSLHIVDPSAPVKPLSNESTESLEVIPATAGTSTALLPNLTEDANKLPTQFGISSPFSANPGPSIWAPGSPSWEPSHRLQNPHWMAYARVEPGPLAILHHSEHEILAGGRFPSILSYDRRYFPRLQYVIHSSASLSALASIPYPPAMSGSSRPGTSTLIACGEYRGRGSLEIYSLPHVKVSNNLDDGSASLDHPYSYKNRQDASSSKLLSVATHGTRIVYSDSEGGLKWVERDGRSLVRRWNINSFDLDAKAIGTGINSNMLTTSRSGDEVARKIVPLTTMPASSVDSDTYGYGKRGDDDLLVWTGERVGIVTTQPQRLDHREVVNAMESAGQQEDTLRDLRHKEEEYAQRMRLALERQADERRWMSRFRFKTGRW